MSRAGRWRRGGAGRRRRIGEAHTKSRMPRSGIGRRKIGGRLEPSRGLGTHRSEISCNLDRRELYDGPSHRRAIMPRLLAGPAAQGIRGSVDRGEPNHLGIDSGIARKKILRAFSLRYQTRDQMHLDARSPKSRFTAFDIRIAGDELPSAPEFTQGSRQLAPGLPEINLEKPTVQRRHVARRARKCFEQFPAQLGYKTVGKPALERQRHEAAKVEQTGGIPGPLAGDGRNGPFVDSIVDRL